MTITENSFDVRTIPDLFDFDTQRIELAKQRQCAFWEGRQPDKWPVYLGGCLTPEQEAIPHYNLKETFFGQEEMLCTEVRGAINMGGSGSDGVPSLRVNYGTGLLLSCFGLEQEVYEDKMPWLLTHLTKKEASKLDPDNIKPDGTFARGLEVMKFYKEILGDSIAIYCMDTQGPFDLAHLLIGDDLFYQVYDDAEYVHHIMEVCTALNIKAHTWMKEISGEPRHHIWHGNSMYAENMGVRICEDTTALLGEDIMREFAMPYTARVARHFGGAWIHYCGRNDHLTKAVLEIPDVRAINFGHIPGHMHDQPFEEKLQEVKDAGKIYTGGWPRFDDEASTDYVKRLHRWASQGVLITNIGGAIEEGTEIDSREKALEFWYSL